MKYMLIDAILCAFAIYALYRRTKKEGHYILRTLLHSSWMTMLITAITIWIYDATIGLSISGDELIGALLIFFAGAGLLLIASIILGIIYFKQMKPIYVTMLMCVVLMTIQTLIHNYLTKDTTFDEYFHILVFYYLLFTTVLFVLLLVARARILKRKNIKFNKLLYWLLPALIVYTPIVIEFI